MIQVMRAFTLLSGIVIAMGVFVAAAMFAQSVMHETLFVVTGYIIWRWLATIFSQEIDGHYAAKQSAELAKICKELQQSRTLSTEQCEYLSMMAQETAV